LFVYFTHVLANVQEDRSIINKHGYDLDRKGTWKRGVS